MESGNGIMESGNGIVESGNENGVRDLRMIGAAELRELEPHCRV